MTPNLRALANWHSSRSACYHKIFRCKTPEQSWNKFSPMRNRTPKKPHSASLCTNKPLLVTAGGRDASLSVDEFSIPHSTSLHIVHSSEDVHINLRHFPDIIYYYIYGVEVWSNSPTERCLCQKGSSAVLYQDWLHRAAKRNQPSMSRVTVPHQDSRLKRSTSTRPPSTPTLTCSFALYKECLQRSVERSRSIG